MTPQEILTAALSNPDVLWAILTADVKVAGPWERDGDSRRAFSGGGQGRWDAPAVVAEVLRCKNGHENPYDTDYCPECGKRTNVTMYLAFSVVAETDTVHRSRAEAESWCDAQLREAGWLLASGEVERG